MDAPSVKILSKEEIRNKFSEEDTASHALIRELLWLFYPQDEDRGYKSIPSDDHKADEVACYIIEALNNKRKACLG